MLPQRKTFNIFHFLKGTIEKRKEAKYQKMKREKEDIKGTK